MCADTPRARSAFLAALAAVLVSGCYLRHERPVECDAGVLCNTCVEGTCNHDTGEGCAEGEGCYFVAIDPDTGAVTTGCLPTRSRPIGAACTTNSDCQSGLACLQGPGFSRPAFCVPPCCGTAGCPAGMECAPTHAVERDAGPGAPLEVGTCLWSFQACDVVLQTGCPAGQACYLAPNPTCMAPGTRTAGAACLSLGDCAPGLACIAEEDGSARCHRVCIGDHECEGGLCDRSETLLSPGRGICR